MVDRLRHAGFDAYLVGGCVRDLLLGRAPKDFDVASDATPEEVRTVFSHVHGARVRVVGRRFRIAHVRMHREVIEVSTFRRGLDEGDESRPVTSSTGLILHDNAFGAIDEDAFRRDFTVNALYYDPIDHVIFDYCDGLADITERTLRVIGEPERRFREDPVRVLRAIRFAAKLDLKLHPTTERAIAPAAAMLADVPAARLFDEFGKLFLAGQGARTFDLLRQHGLVGRLLPISEDGGALARLALANTDHRLDEGKPVTPGFLLAAFLWHRFVQRVPTSELAAASDEQLDEAAVGVLREQQSTLAIPRRHAWFTREVWRLQPRLDHRTNQTVPTLLSHRRFRAAYDFLVLRAELDDSLAELARWWTEAQTLTADQLAEQLPRERRPGRRRRRRYARGNRRSRNATTTASGAAAAP